MLKQSSRPPRRAALAAAALATCALAGAAAATGASGADGTASQTGVGSVSTVLSGLDNPRNLAFDRFGNLFVAESGRAGTTCQGTGEDQQCIGNSSAVRKIGRRGNRRVISGLPSLGGIDGTFTGGVHGVSVDPDGNLFAVTTGLPPEARAGVPEAQRNLLGKLLRIRRGSASVRANLDNVEYRANPDRTDVNPNPYSVVALRGRQYVLDAGGNTLLRVDGRHVRVVAVLPQNGNAQSVPTALTRGPDGALYVGEFVGENVRPKPAARVFRIVPGRRGVRRTRIEIFRTGFSNISGLAFDSRGNLYVTELAVDPTGESPAGDVVRVTPRNQRTRLAGSALFFPTGGAVRGRFLYVSNWSVLTGDPGPQGSPFAGQSGTVVRIRIR